MNAPTAVAGFLYVGLATAGLALSGMPVAYWKGVLQPALSGGLAASEGEPQSHLAFRIAAFVGLSLFSAVLAVVLSPLSIYRCLWQIWQHSKVR